MLICEGDNSVEIVAIDRVSDHLPTPGDTQFEIKIQSFGFAGQGWAWVSAACLAAFVEQLRTLELERQGCAEIESISPRQFWLRIWAIDRLGHTALTGRLTGRLQKYETQLTFAHSLEFGFQFSPDLLPRIVRDFEAIASGVRN